MAESRPDIIRATASDTGTERPEWLANRLQWFEDLKFGLFMHWGPYSQWGCIESWPLVEEDTWGRPDTLKAWTDRDRDLERFRRDYFALNRTFDPTQFDPVPWAEAAGRAGMKYVAFTTKHHDGFCMFDTRTTDYRITHPDCPFSRDPRANIARLVFGTFRERGFATSCYFSKSDWHCPWYWVPGRPMPNRNPNYDTHAEPEIWEQFVRFVHAQIEELMTGYGHMDVLWLDGGQVRPPDQDIRMAEIAAMARSHQPGLLIADRTVGGPFENILTPEQEIPDAPLGVTWESCLTMGNSWAYKPDDTYKSTRTLLRLLTDIVAKGGNLLLNIGPSPEGLFPPEAMQRLTEIGDWMEVNSEAIHGTRAIAPYAESDIRYTAKGDSVYAIVQASGDAPAPPPAVLLSGVIPPEGAPVHLLGGAEPLNWRLTDAGAEVTLPQGPLPCEHAWTLKFPRP
jgi:alpha-L-fucosidase